VIGGTAAECEAQRRAMIERGEAGEADDFVFRVIVSAGASEGRARSLSRSNKV